MIIWSGPCFWRSVTFIDVSISYLLISFPQVEGQKKYLSLLGGCKISLSIPLLTTRPEFCSTLRNCKALPVKDYPLASIQSLLSLILVGHDQEKQEGWTVTPQILRSHGVLLHKASKEIKIFMITFSNLKQMHLLSAVPNSPTLKLIQPAPPFCEAHVNHYRQLILLREAAQVILFLKSKF